MSVFKELLWSFEMSSIPSGIICMWGGAVSDIPDGWVLCDGENNTPDLRDRFIIGAGGNTPVADIGGNTSSTVTLSGRTGGTAITIDQMPSHSHIIGSTFVTDSERRELVNSSYDYIRFVGTSTTTASYTGGNQAHDHSISGTFGVNILPPYYALCYIKKL